MSRSVEPLDRKPESEVAASWSHPAAASAALFCFFFFVSFLFFHEPEEAKWNCPASPGLCTARRSSFPPFPSESIEGLLSCTGMLSKTVLMHAWIHLAVFSPGSPPLGPGWAAGTCAWAVKCSGQFHPPGRTNENESHHF